MIFHFADLLDWQNSDERIHCHMARLNEKNDSKVMTDIKNEDSHMYRKCFGHTVTVNDEEIALFRIGDEVFAIQAKCPHLGMYRFMFSVCSMLVVFSPFLLYCLPTAKPVELVFPMLFQALFCLAKSPSTSHLQTCRSVLLCLLLQTLSCINLSCLSVVYL